MRIHFASAERPKSVARKLRKVMKERGEPIAQHRSLDIVASLYGYQDWQELSFSVGKRPASLDDSDVIPEIASARRAQQTEALRRHGFPADLTDRLVSILAATGTSSPVVGAPTTHVLDSLLHRAFRSRATEVHVEPHDGRYSVHFRRAGERELVHMGPLAEYEVLKERLKDRSGMDLREVNAAQEGNFQLEYAGDVYGLGVVTVPTTAGERLVTTVLGPESVRPGLVDMGITTISDWLDALRWESFFVVASANPEIRGRTDEATRRDLGLQRKSVATFDRETGHRVTHVGSKLLRNPVKAVLERFMRTDADVIAIGEMADVGIARTVRNLHNAGHPILATLDAGTMEGAVRALRELGFADAEIRRMSVFVADGNVDDYISNLDRRSVA